MRIAARAIQWIFIIVFPLFLMTATIAFAINFQPLYEYGFRTYGVSQTTGLAAPELSKAAHGLISYFNSRDEYINVTVLKDNRSFQLFNQREVGHLKDVKELVQLDYKVLLGTGIIVVACVLFGLLRQRGRRRQSLARSVFIGSGLALVIMLALGIGSLLNFEQLFLQFHLLSFANDLWQLDPSRDYLIMLFPEGFWYDAALFCGIVTTVLGVVLGAVSWVYLRRRGHNPPPA